jgi:hypothetical protein
MKQKNKYVQHFNWKSENRLLERLWRKWEGNMKMDVKEIACENTG